MATSKRVLFAGVAIVFGAGFLMGSTMQGIEMPKHNLPTASSS